MRTPDKKHIQICYKCDILKHFKVKLRYTPSYIPTSSAQLISENAAFSGHTYR